MKKGIFLSFEGIDGCGKTTQLARLAQRMRDQGLELVETVEPGGTEVGRAVRRLLLDPMLHGLDARAELLLYFASRAQNAAECIVPALNRGATVLCDRFTDSTIVYQGAGRGIPRSEVTDLHRIACGDLVPDVTLLLDIDLECSLKRAHARNHAEGSQETRMDNESRAFFERVREGYLALSREEPSRIKTVDATGSMDEVAQRIWEVVGRHV